RTITRWAIVFAVLLAVGYIAKRSSYFPRRVILSWAVLTPALLVPLMLILNQLVRRILCDPLHACRVIFVGCNSSSIALARRMTSPEVGMRLLGFFDDRTVDRIGLKEPSLLLGKHTDVASYVKAHNVQVVFISLPIRHAKRFID